jgi:hypothetical protein
MDSSIESAPLNSTQTISVGDEVRTEQQFAHIAAGTYCQVSEIYETNGEVYVVLGKYANASGPEWDGSIRAIQAGFRNGKLRFAEYDTQMHD